MFDTIATAIILVAIVIAVSRFNRGMGFG